MSEFSFFVSPNKLIKNKEGLQRQIFRNDLRRFVLAIFKPGDVLDLDDMVGILYARHGLLFKKQDIKDILIYLLRKKLLKKIGDDIYAMLLPQKKKRMTKRDERETK